MTEPLDVPVDISTAELEQIVELCDRYEAALRAGEPGRGSEFNPVYYKTLSPKGEAFREAQFESLRAAYANSMKPRLNNYADLEEIDRGGMGVVYKAKDTKLDRLVALKMILASGYTSAEALVRFENEAKTLAWLQHPNVVQVYEVGEYEGKPFFSMEFCGGGNLAKKLAHKRIDPMEAADLVQTLALAIRAAHSNNILHRDLKPANVLFAVNGAAKISDFGLAKKLGERGQTKTGELMGTPSYMAPEQAQGSTKLTAATDVYSLGAILYECLTGRPPFQAANTLETLLQIKTDEPAPPTQLNPAVPRDLESICLKCLEKIPTQRYTSAEELANDLGRFRCGQPVQARPISNLERVRRWCRRNPTVASLGMATGISLLLGIVVAIAFAVEKSLDVERLRDANLKIGKKQEETNAALVESRKNLIRAADFAHYRGIDCCQQGDVGQGLLWFAHSLQLLTPTGDIHPQKAIRRQIAFWWRELPGCRLTFWDEHIDVMAFSPDSKKIVTFSFDGTARLWDTVTGRSIGNPFRHQLSFKAIAFSPDSRSVVTVSIDGTAQLWDADTGNPISNPLLHKVDVVALAFGPNGKNLFTRNLDGTARLRDATISNQLDNLDNETVLIRSSPHGVRWVPVIGETIDNPRFLKPHVAVVAYSPNGMKTILSQGKDQTAKAWDAKTSKHVGDLLRQLHRGDDLRAHYNPVGEMILTNRELVEPDLSPSGVFRQNALQFWEPATGKPIGPPLITGGTISLKFSEDGKYVLVNTNRAVGSWQIPEPVNGSAERIELWIQVITGKELSESGETSDLDFTTWLARRSLLQAMAGAPLP